MDKAEERVLMDLMDERYERAMDEAYKWYTEYQYVDLTRTYDANDNKAILNNLLLALSILLPEYEATKVNHTGDDYPEGVLPWFCATYGWFYYSYQQDKINKMQAFLQQADLEPELKAERQFFAVDLPCRKIG